MSEINYLLQEIGFTDITLILFASLLAAKSAIETLTWFCEKAGVQTKWTLQKKKETEMLFAHEEMIRKLAAYEQDTHNDVKDIKDLLENHISQDNERTVASLRTSLYKLHKEFVKQNSISNEELKTFMELGKVYQDAGGDDIYHSKLEPEVLALPIR